MSALADWLGRTLLLVLSGLATLAILTSIMSATRRPEPAAVEVAPRDSAMELVPVEPGNAAAPVLEAVPVEAAADREIARWLEALTYAVLALAGFAAAGLLVLLRITAHLARIADGR